MLLCNRHHHPSLNFFIFPAEALSPLDTNSPSPGSWPPLSTFCLYECGYLGTSYQTERVLFCLAYFTQHHALKGTTKAFYPSSNQVVASSGPQRSQCIQV